MNTKSIVRPAMENTRQILVDFLRGNFYPASNIKCKPQAERPLSRRRIEFIDLAKGVCILLVVIFHSPRVSVDVPGVAAMRMPLYFILSGLFFKTYGGLVELIEKKLNKIIIPLLFFIGIDIIWQFIDSGIFDWRQPANLWTDGQHLHNIPIWFLCALFFSNIIFCLISICLHRPMAVAAAVVATGAAGALLTHHHVYLPFYLTQALNGIPFFYIGYMLRSTSLLTPNRLDRFNLLIAAALLAAGISICLLAKTTPRLDFFQNHFDNGVLFYPVALLMVGGLLFLCKAIRWLPIISYLGRYSIIVLGLHQLLLFQLRWAKVPLTDHKLMGWTLCGAVVLICWLAIPLLTKLLPGLTAQKDWLRIPRKKPHFPSAHIPRFLRHSKSY